MSPSLDIQSPEAELVLRVTDLTVRLEGQVALSGVSFDVKRGDVLTILGPNGAGKSVLLRALLGVLPYSGSITWSKNTSLGYVPQRLPYVRDIPLSVAEFFALKAHPSAKHDAPGWLQEVGLTANFLGKRMGDLSSGQFQRVLIAWALSGSPSVLLFDEPTTGVDVRGEETVYALLGRLHREQGLTTLIVTHDLAVVHRLSSNVLCLSGRTLCQGPPLQTLTPENLQRLYGSDVKFYGHKHE